MLDNHDNYRVLAGNMQMFLRDWPGNGPPVVFLHSFTANSLLALRLGVLLTPHRRLIAPDLRGRGRSDAPHGDYNLLMHERSVLALLDRLNIERCVISGHSMGAAISLMIAADHPDRTAGLILFDGGTPPNPLAGAMLDAYYGSLTYHYASADAYIERFKTSPLYQPWTEDLELLVRSNLYPQPDGTYTRSVARHIIQAERSPAAQTAWDRLPDLYGKVRCPVLIVRAGWGVLGKEDQVLSDDDMRALLSGMPHAQVVTVENAGHTSVLTIPHAGRDNAICGFLGIG